VQKGNVLIFLLVGIVVLAAIGGAFYLGRSTTPKPSPNPVTTSQTNLSKTPQPVSSNENNITLNPFNIGEFVASFNKSDQTQTIYLVQTEFDSSSKQIVTKKIKIIGPVNSQSYFTDIKISPNNSQFTFRLSGPGDGHADYLASVDGSSTKELKLPNNYLLDSSTIIGWVNDTDLLVKEITKSSLTASDEQVSYWTVKVNNLKNRKIISF